MKETEYKFLMDKEKFYEILALIKDRYTDAEYKDVIQINYYYDTDDNYLLSNHTTLRARQTENSLRLELKESQQLTGNDYSVANETCMDIEKLKSDITLESGKYAWIPFSLQGELVTHRISIRPSDSLSIDFDVNFYLGKCDYEIEMEFKDMAEKGTKVLIDKLDLMKYINTVGGKARRFFLYKGETL